MRISDWSSDVCSSDLRIASGIALGDRDDGAIGRPWPARHRRDPDHRIGGQRRERIAAPDVDIMGTAVGRLDDQIMPEIGRASCRERVWPYVWISGVGVTLKKKN